MSTDTAFDDSGITVGELRRHLEIFSDDDRLVFSSPGLKFSRVKSRGPGLVYIELSPAVFRDASGRLVVDNHS